MRWIWCDPGTARSDPEVIPALVRSLLAWAFAGVGGVGVVVVGVVRWKVAIKNNRRPCRCLSGYTIVKH